MDFRSKRHIPDKLTSGNCPLNGKLGGYQTRSKCFRGKNIFQAFRELNQISLVAQLVAYSLH